MVTNFDMQDGLKATLHGYNFGFNTSKIMVTWIEKFPFVFSAAAMAQATDLHRGGLGSIPADTHRSHWWRPQGRPAKTPPVQQ